MLHLSLALRNLRRNLRRSLLTAAAVAVGLSLMLFTVTFQHGSYDMMIRSAISAMAGHVVVQAPGWQQERDEALLVRDADAIQRDLQRALPDAIVIERVFLEGLLTSTQGSVGVSLEGVDPEGEGAVQDLPEQLIAGEWLDEDPRGLLIGAEMAETLQVEVGDKVVYMGQHLGHEVSSQMFRVRGVFKTGAAELDAFIAMAPLSATQELLGVPGAAHQISVHLDDARLSIHTADQVRGLLAGRDLEVLYWREALPELYAFIQLDRSGGDLMLAVIGLIITLGVVNTMLMSVLERTRELGVLLSIGMRRERVGWMIVQEGFALALIGTAGGVLGGLVLSWPVVTWGLDLGGAVGGESMEMGGAVMSSVLKGSWDPTRSAIYVLASVLITTAASFYPAIRAALLHPIDALRHS
ncbi:MAG: ABC transporter permease [Deltaproteobacteria bacterium]|nr:ABC transporter permease [Deltaproteobacteria bacterium]